MTQPDSTTPPEQSSYPAQQGYGYQQQPYAAAEVPEQQPYGQPTVPYLQPEPKRSVGKLVTGIMLLVWVSLAILGQLAVLANGRSSAPSASMDPGVATGYVVGRIIGIVVFIIAPLVGGIMLIVKSKPKR